MRSFIICTFYQILLQIKEAEMSGMCSEFGDVRNADKILIEKPERKIVVEKPRRREKHHILECIFEQ
jgi:hypothetical protein